MAKLSQGEGVYYMEVYGQEGIHFEKAYTVLINPKNSATVTLSTPGNHLSAVHPDDVPEGLLERAKAYLTR